MASGQRAWRRTHGPARVDKIPDPFVGDNELRVMWVAESDWEYRRTFSVGATLLEQPNLHLVCDGLDTVADVYLNDVYLGHAKTCSGVGNGT
jgi:beta-mannosidase